MKRLALLATLLLVVPAAAQHVAVPRQLPPQVLMQAREAETPVALRSANIEVEVAAGLARTTLDLVFFNPNRRLLEGELVFPLQPGQEVVGFALDIDGEMRPAVPVAKAKGRQVFEAIERRRVDPALLERTQGNFFRLRVYPIPAGGTRRVRLSLAESLARDGGSYRLRLPLDFARGLADVELRVRGGRPDVRGLALQREGRDSVAHLSARHLAARDGLTLRWPVGRGDSAHVQRSVDETHFVAEIPVTGTAAPRALPRRIGLLWDASASARKRDAGLDLAVLDGYLRALGNADVRLVVLRDRAEAPRTFHVTAGDWSALRAALKATVLDGATNLGDWTPEADIAEYVLVSDGLGNYGKGVFPTLGPKQRLFAINSAGASADAARLQALALAHGGRAIDVTTPAEVDAAVAQLLTDAPRLVGIDAIGAQDVVAESPFPRGGVLRVAGRLTSPQARVALDVLDGARTRRVELKVTDTDATDGDLVARTWASYRLRELGAEPERNRTRIRLLGQRYGIATGETSLIVLETLADYVQYDVVPPPALLAAFEAQRRDVEAGKAAARAQHLEAVAARFADKQAWWARTFPTRRPMQVAADGEREQSAPAGPAVVFEDASPVAVAAPAPAPAPPASAPVPADAAAAMAGAPAPERSERAAEQRDLDTVVVTGSRIGDGRDDADADAAKSVQAEATATGRTIQLQPWAPDSAFARRLRAARPEEVYALYLDEREAHADSTAFYLDVADILLGHGQRDLALRVLSNLAEMQLENRHVLRVLGYRLAQAKAYDLAVPVLEQVLAMAEEEPQSWRDLGLALAEAGEPQRAIEALYEVIKRPWDGRFTGVEQIVLAELNAIIARTPRPLDTTGMDPRLLHNLPLALRAALSWDSDNSDMDLWVTQPDGESCSYSLTLTAIGMRFEDDFTGGYGPEECALRRAPPGKYQVRANFYGSSEQVVTGATTVQLWLSTDFGTPRQKDERVTLRLSGQSENVLVGEFEVK